jgi:hypothetical protein
MKLLCLIVVLCYIANGLKLPMTKSERDIINPNGMATLAEDFFDPNRASIISYNIRL